MTAIHLDDIKPGDRARSSRVTVTEAHIVWFAGLTGDFNPLHMDAEAAKANGFGRTIAHGMLTHSLSTGLRSTIDDWAILAFLEQNWMERWERESTAAFFIRHVEELFTRGLIDAEGRPSTARAWADKRADERKAAA